MYKIKGGTATIDPKAPLWSEVQTSHADQKVVMVDPTKTARPIDIPGNPVPKLSAADIKARAVKNIGPRPKDRIPHVARKIKHLEGNTGILVSWEGQKEIGGPTNIAQTNRPLNGATPYSSADTTTIPAYPIAGSSAPTAADKTAVRNWLEFFLTRLQYD